MTQTNADIIEQIKRASDVSGIRLKRACEVGNINYSTTQKQVLLGRPIPAATISALSLGFDLPISFFLQSKIGTYGHSTAASLAMEANLEKARKTRAGRVISTDEILDWYRDNSGILKNHEWFEDQMDLYETIRPEDEIMHPILFGENSITPERLMLTSKTEYYERLDGLGAERVRRALESHFRVLEGGVHVSDEIIDATIKGVKLDGGWRKITMNCRCPRLNRNVTAVVSFLTWIGN